ncbi:MAG TPA: sugar ABC transporter permease [Caldilineaceae bacterium]|nr:sugar ABC transporter permease [Caldilineaceae bacterium]
MANQTLSVPLGKPAAPGRWARWREEWAENGLAYVLLVPSVVAFAVFLLFPIANMFVASFSRVDTIGRIMEFGTLDNYAQLLADRRLPMILRQTVIFAFGTVWLTVLASFPLALILNSRFPGQTLAKALILIPWAMPYAVSAITWRWIFHGQMGALNYFLSQIGLIREYIVWLGDPVLAFGAAMFVEVWSSVPFMTITFLAGLQAIPPTIYDAAKMDGASPWREFLDMTLPQMKTVIMVVTLLSIIWAFRSFAVIWILTQGDPVYRTDIAVTYLYKLAFENLHFGAGFALAVGIFLVLTIFSIIYTRVLRSEEP